VAEIFREVLEIPSEDGVIFKPETLRAAAARAEDEYSGVSLDVQAELAGARLPIHVDIGYGDAITPGVLDINYPSLLDMPMPRLKACPPETVLAEKFQAMTALGIANSRMKDFFDIWAIANTFAFEGPVLAAAIAATFARRETAPPAQPPLALSTDFAESLRQVVEWPATWTSRFCSRCGWWRRPPATASVEWWCSPSPSSKTARASRRSSDNAKNTCRRLRGHRPSSLNSATNCSRTPSNPRCSES
jgi:hypothetical protein